MKPENELKPVMFSVRLTGEEALFVRKIWRYDLNSENKSDFIRNAIRFYSNHIAELRKQEAMEWKTQ